MPHVIPVSPVDHSISYRSSVGSIERPGIELSFGPQDFVDSSLMLVQLGNQIAWKQIQVRNPSGVAEEGRNLGGWRKIGLPSSVFDLLSRRMDNSESPSVEAL